MSVTIGSLDQQIRASARAISDSEVEEVFRTVREYLDDGAFIFIPIGHCNTEVNQKGEITQIKVRVQVLRNLLSGLAKKYTGEKREHAAVQDFVGQVRRLMDQLGQVEL